MSTQSAPALASWVAALAVLALAPVVNGQVNPAGEWRYWGADGGTSHYSRLDQITQENVNRLRIAWRWKTENFGPRPDFNYRATPLVVGGILFTTAGSRRDVVAIDGTTGETLWMFRHDEGDRGQRAPNRGASGRGLAYWTDGRAERLFYVSLGYRLIALNPKTGLPIPEFGQNGVVDLFEGLDQLRRPGEGDMGLTSPPAVVRDVVVVGAALRALASSPEFVAGFPRGFDARTGKLLWTFHTIPRPGEFGNDTWENDSWSYTGNTGVWGPISVDEQLGYVYLGVEAPTNDYYGGHRLGDNLFANSIVCLNARTGRRVWHYQLIHHDIWDYDIPAAANLVDVVVDGKKVRALAQVTKQAFVYVFDRVTGQPIWPIEERPVPPSDVPGERAALTQPFPTKPAPYDRQGISVDDLIDLTPVLKERALEIVNDFRLGPLFTPPSVVGANGKKATLMLPSVNGGSNWQGAAADPETGILYVPSASNVWALSVTQDQKRSKMHYVGGSGFLSEIRPQGLPLIKPPWGRITAIDLNSGERLWMISNGPAPEYVRNHVALKGVDLSDTGSGDTSGLLVTKTLLFAGQGCGLHGVPPGSGGPWFRAIDKQTGNVVHQMKLPANQCGLPMTYLAGGKQYIVVAVGAQGVPAELIALSLP